MLTWVIVTATAVVAVGVLTLLVVREPVNRPQAGAAVEGPQHVRRSFRVVWPGYDPAEVDAHLAAIETAWAVGELDRLGGDDRGGGRDRSGEELEEGGGDGPGVFDG